jgi:hypothetical protein
MKNAIVCLALCAVPLCAGAQKLGPTTLGPDDAYGRSVSTDGDRIAVGAPSVSGGDGAVVVWRRTAGGWELEDALFHYDPGFGTAVAIDGDTLVVGAASSHTVWVLVRNGSGWSLSQTLTDLPSGELIELRGDVLVVEGQFYRRSAGLFSLDFDIGFTEGSVIDIDFDGTRFAYIAGPMVAGGQISASVWRLVGPSSFVAETVQPIDLEQAGEHVHVAVENTALAVMDADSTRPLRIFRRSGSSWYPSAEFDPPGVGPDGGDSLDLHGDRIAVGDTDGGVSLYRRVDGIWVEDFPMLQSSDAYAGDGFGHSLAIDDHGVVVGAPSWFSRRSPDTLGAAYYFTFQNHGYYTDAGRDLAIYARVLFGVTQGGNGVVIIPGEGPVPVDPEPFRLWSSLSAAQRTYVIDRVGYAYRLLLRDPSSPEALRILSDPLAGAPRSVRR